MRRSPLISVLAALLLVQTLPAQEPKGKESPPISLVTSERLRQAEKEPGNWLMYSGQYNGQRHCRLDQINDQNVHDRPPTAGNFTANHVPRSSSLLTSIVPS